MIHSASFADPNARPPTKQKKHPYGSGGGGGGGGSGGGGGGGSGSGGGGWPRGGGRFRTMGDVQGGGSK